MTRKAQIPAGTRFGRLVVLEYWPDPRDPRHPKYRCRCDCGNETFVQRDNFARTRSCGCLRTEELLARSVTHGMSKSLEYRAWCDLRDRCTRPTRPDFARYGGRGITVCQRWRESFENFYADMGPKPSAQHEIDRIDNDKGYEPSNCRWATQKQQRINQRRMKLYTYRGLTGTVKDLAKAFHANRHTVHDRLWRKKWAIEAAMAEGIRVQTSHDK